MNFQAGRVSDRAGLGPAHRGWSSFELLPRRRRTTSPAQVFLLITAPGACTGTQDSARSLLQWTASSESGLWRTARPLGKCAAYVIHWHGPPATVVEIWTVSPIFQRGPFQNCRFPLRSRTTTSRIPPADDALDVCLPVSPWINVAAQSWNGPRDVSAREL